MADVPLVPGQEEEDEGDDTGMDGATWLALAGVDDPGPLPARAAPSPWLVVAPLLAACACAGVAALAVGPTGLVAGLVAGLVVVLFFASGTVPLHLSPALGDATGTGLVLLLTNYVCRVGLALLVPLVLVSLGWADRGTIGVAVVVCALVRVNAQVLLLHRSRVRTGAGPVGGSR